MAPIVWVSVVVLVAGFVNSEPTVKNSLGTFLGKTETFEGTDVESFLGVPYAKPPVGDLRFAHPQAFGSVGELNATQFSKQCHQAKILPQPPHPESEDCLFLNVFRKAGTQQGAKKPVIFLIHGGAFCIGAASHPFYNSLPMVSMGDVIVVGINYRLGIFGFGDMKDLAPGNLGLFDQLLALEWVRDNIEGFGGDPDQVTLVGVSAGSMSASALLNSPLVRDKKLFKKAIMDAGVMSRTIVMSQDASLNRMKGIAGKLGCATEGQEMLSCLRKANATELSDLSFDPNVSTIFTFVPTVDGKFIPVDPTTDTQENSDKFADVKIIVGTAKNEGSMFAAMHPGVPTLKTEDDFLTVCKHISKWYLYPVALENQNVKNTVVQTYFGKSKDHFNDVAEFISDGTFVCPTNAFVKNYAKTHKNVYVYNFERLMKQKYLRFDPKIAGAYHGSPFGHMYGAFLAMPETALGVPLDPDDRQFMIDALQMVANFVKSDDVPKFRGVTWPNYSKGGGILVINDEPSVGTGLVHQDSCKKVFPFFDEPEAPRDREL